MFDEIKRVCAFVRYSKIYNKATMYVNELILTPFSPFDIKCKKRNVKNVYFYGIQESEFFGFSQHCTRQVGGAPSTF